MEKLQEKSEFTPLRRKRSQKLHKKRKKQPSLLFMLESYNQLPRIYGPTALRFSPLAARRPHTNHTLSRVKPHSCKNNPTHTQHRPELETVHKVRENYFRALPPIPQLSEEEPEPQRHRGKSKKVYSSATKNTTATQLAAQHKKYTAYETDQSNFEDEDLRVSKEGCEARPAHTSSPKKRRKRYKTLNQISVTPNKQSVMQSLVMEVTEPSQSTQFNQQLQNGRVSMLRQLLTKSIRSDIFKINLPQKLEDIPSFVQAYRPINPELATVRESGRFKIVSYKGLKALYFGECIDKDKRHGLGIYLCQNLLFEGTFANDSKEFGLEVTHEGVYRGAFQSGKRNGSGEFEWYNGESYRGEWKNNMKHGEGVWQRPNGQSYTGQWHQNTLHGTGKYCFSDKHYYEGGFKNFVKNGVGYEQFSNGDVYEGQYKDGLPEGKGRYIWSSEQYYEGEWHKGMREGYGTHVKGKMWRYEGQYIKDKRHGHGQLTANDCTYAGSFENNTFLNGTIKNSMTGTATPFSSNTVTRQLHN